MNQEHFNAKYSPLGIELEVLSYQASFKMAKEYCAQATDNPKVDSENVSKDIAENNIIDTIQLYPRFDISNNSGLKI